jgi:hypothetical protein
MNEGARRNEYFMVTLFTHMFQSRVARIYRIPWRPLLSEA